MALRASPRDARAPRCLILSVGPRRSPLYNGGVVWLSPATAAIHLFWGLGVATSINGSHVNHGEWPAKRHGASRVRRTRCGRHGAGLEYSDWAGQMAWFWVLSHADENLPISREL